MEHLALLQVDILVEEVEDLAVEPKIFPLPVEQEVVEQVLYFLEVALAVLVQSTRAVVAAQDILILMAAPGDLG
jgi:hypothetical protein